MDYGTGAIMSVPAHDDRDYEFAKKYGLEIRLVILPLAKDVEDTVAEPALPFVGHDGMLINSGRYNTLSCDEAIKTMSAYAEDNRFGKATVTYRLKDWGISRQRYWGTPIPMLYCEKDGIVPVPEKDLPVILPENASRSQRIAARAQFQAVPMSEVRRTGARSIPWTCPLIHPGILSPYRRA
jgi:leucyl-tRNA synthetase